MTNEEELAREHALWATKDLLRSEGGIDRLGLIAKAQVHATLAVAFATLAMADVQKKQLALGRETVTAAHDYAAKTDALMEGLP